MSEAEIDEDEIHLAIQTLMRIYEPNTRFLKEHIDNSYNMDEFKGLCFALNVRFDDLSGDILGTKVISLINYMENRKRLDELITAVFIARPTNSLRLFFKNKSRAGGYTLGNDDPPPMNVEHFRGPF